MMQHNLNPRCAKRVRWLGFKFWLLTVCTLLILSSGRAGLASSGKKVAIPDLARPGFEAIHAEDMQAILKFLASDELEGRATARRGLKVAAKFLQSQYRLAGLIPAPGQKSMLQKFFIVESTVDPKTHISLKQTVNNTTFEKKYRVYQDFYMTYRGAASIVIEAPIVFVGYGLDEPSIKYNDFANVNVKDKVVLVLPGLPKSQKFSRALSEKQLPGRFASRRAKATKAREAGASAIFLVSNRSIPAMVSRFKRWLNRPSYSLLNNEKNFAQFMISSDMANAILAANGTTVEALQKKIEKSGKPASFIVKNIRAQIEVKVDSEMKETQNVVAYLPGSDSTLKQEVVAFGAHYDHLGTRKDGTIYNGADDDGSGTTAILEIARAFAQNPNRPRRSLLFISHTGEERGLLGSNYYTRNPLVPLEKMDAMLNIDMIGRNEENSVYIIGSNFLSQELHDINEQANQSVGLNLDYKYNSTDDPNRFYYRSDHYNYAKNNIPIIFFFTGTHEDYHQPTDTVDKINFQKMTKIARLVYLTAWKVANLDHRLKLNGVLKAADK